MHPCESIEYNPLQGFIQDFGGWDSKQMLGKQMVHRLSGPRMFSLVELKAGLKK